jgi:hypothetical protein
MPYGSSCNGNDLLLGHRRLQADSKLHHTSMNL